MRTRSAVGASQRGQYSLALISRSALESNCIHRYLGLGLRISRTVGNRRACVCGAVGRRVVSSVLLRISWQLATAMYERYYRWASDRVDSIHPACLTVSVTCDSKDIQSLSSFGQSLPFECAESNIVSNQLHEQSNQFHGGQSQQQRPAESPQPARTFASVVPPRFIGRSNGRGGGRFSHVALPGHTFAFCPADPKTETCRLSKRFGSG